MIKISKSFESNEMDLAAYVGCLIAGVIDLLRIRPCLAKMPCAGAEHKGFNTVQIKAAINDCWKDLDNDLNLDVMHWFARLIWWKSNRYFSNWDEFHYQMDRGMLADQLNELWEIWAEEHKNGILDQRWLTIRLIRLVTESDNSGLAPITICREEIDYCLRRVPREVKHSIACRLRDWIRGAVHAISFEREGLSPLLKISPTAELAYMNYR